MRGQSPAGEARKILLDEDQKMFEALRALTIQNIDYMMRHSRPRSRISFKRALACVPSRDVYLQSMVNWAWRQ